MRRNFLEHKGGLSTVVTMLIIVLLVLVAIGIVWYVVKGVVESGTGQIDYSVKCLGVDVKATNVRDAGTSAYWVVNLKREPGTDSDKIGGVKLIFSNAADDNSDVITINENIDVLGTIEKTLGPVEKTGTDENLTSPDKVDVTVFFLDKQNKERICKTSNEFNF